MKDIFKYFWLIQLNIYINCNNNKIVINCITCKKPGHVAENFYHLTKAQEAV